MTRTTDSKTARIAFLNREVSRDIEAEVELGVNREWLEAIVADATAELARLTYQPGAVPFTAAAAAEEARFGRLYRAGFRRE